MRVKIKRWEDKQKGEKGKGKDKVRVTRGYNNKEGQKGQKQTSNDDDETSTTSTPTTSEEKPIEETPSGGLETGTTGDSRRAGTGGGLSSPEGKGMEAIRGAKGWGTREIYSIFNKGGWGKITPLKGKGNKVKVKLRGGVSKE